MTNTKRESANMNTVLAINFMDIKVPKPKYIIYMFGTLQRIKNIDAPNNSVTVVGIFDGIEDCYKLSDIKDKFIKFVSVHSKITHSIQHTCINNVLKLIKSYSESVQEHPDNVISEIISNKLVLPMIGKVVPCYIFPKDNDKVSITSKEIIIKHKLINNSLQIGNIKEIYRKNKNTIYTLFTPVGDIKCERDNFKLVGKKDRKDLFYVL